MSKNKPKILVDDARFAFLEWDYRVMIWDLGRTSTSLFVLSGSSVIVMVSSVGIIQKNLLQKLCFCCGQ
jgi:hypothetical protein